MSESPENKVYVVKYDELYESAIIDSIWSTRTLAEKRQEVLRKLKATGQIDFAYCYVSEELLDRERDDFLTKFEADTRKILKDLEAFLVEHYGERCEDFDEECYSCKIWKLHEEVSKILLEPFGD